MNASFLLSDDALLAVTVLTGLHCSEHVNTASIAVESHKGYRYGVVETCLLKSQFQQLNESELKRWLEGDAGHILSTIYPGYRFFVIAHVAILPHGCVQLQITADFIN